MHIKFNIIVKVIPHNQQRYETVGDWFYNPDNKTLWIFVSQMNDWRYEYLVAQHEQIEAALCIQRGIDEKATTAFDIKFEQNRQEGNTDEPGDDPKAPYRAEHFFATTIERLIAAELGVDWFEYDKAIMEL